MTIVYTTEQLTEMKKKAEEKQTKKATLAGKMEAVVAEVKKQFSVSSSQELRDLGEQLEKDVIKANTDYEEACEKYREAYDV